MRHFLLSLAVTAGTFGMGEAPLPTALVTPPRLAYRGTTGSLRAITGTIDLSAIAGATDQYLHAAQRTKKHSPRRLDWLALSSQSKKIWARISLLWDTHPRSLPVRVWGTTPDHSWSIGPVPCLFLDGAMVLQQPITLRPVTPLPHLLNPHALNYKKTRLHRDSAF